VCEQLALAFWLENKTSAIVAVSLSGGFWTIIKDVAVVTTALFTMILSPRITGMIINFCFKNIR
tara:strand:- start:11 stop:202 length:192 start_codon:yes stop_codon:yes gene_type:complete